MSKPIEYDTFAVMQSELLPSIPPEAIPHGALFPINTILKYMPQGGLIVELGSGRGDRSDSFREAGLAGMGVEINEDAVSVANDNGFITFQGDARNFWASEINLAAIAMIENTPAVLLQGLLANIITNRDIRRVIRTADIFLHPGGHLFVAEPVRFENVPWLDANTVYAGHSISDWEHRWKLRYQANQQAGLPKNVFAVVKPGPEKDRLDWVDDSEQVRALIHSDQLERFARHIDPNALTAYAERQYLKLIERKPALMFSRSGEPLPGIHMVFRKVHGLTAKHPDFTYRYSPWYKGMTPSEKADFQDFRLWQKRADPHGYHKDYWAKMRRNFPESMKPPKEYTI